MLKIANERGRQWDGNDENQWGSARWCLPAVYNIYQEEFLQQNNQREFCTVQLPDPVISYLRANRFHRIRSARLLHHHSSEVSCQNKQQSVDEYYSLGHKHETLRDFHSIAALIEMRISSIHRYWSMPALPKILTDSFWKGPVDDRPTTNESLTHPSRVSDRLNWMISFGICAVQRRTNEVNFSILRSILVRKKLGRTDEKKGEKTAVDDEDRGLERNGTFLFCTDCVQRQRRYNALFGLEVMSVSFNALRIDNEWSWKPHMARREER